MKTKIILSVLSVAMMVSTFGQSLELTFTAIDNTTNVQLDSIKVMNRSQEVDTVLHWPDTVLMLLTMGIVDKVEGNTSFDLTQNYPNPVFDQTTIYFCIPEKGNVDLIITDIFGQKVISTKKVLDKGCHEFIFKPGNSRIYICTVLYKNINQSIKMINIGTGMNCTLDYKGRSDTKIQMKTTKTTQGFSFTPGDSLLYIGYFSTAQSGMLDSPTESHTYTFQFATDIPCPGTPTVEYEGQVYNTIQILNQCWLKENLNVGTMINKNVDMTDNGIIEKYCYDNDELNCDNYGGIYQWNEMMEYNYEQGTQGICPQGWHIPTDEEWKIMEGAADSQYGIGDSEWDLMFENRGFDIGLNLRINGWNGMNLYGFSGKPGGYLRNSNNSFMYINQTGLWWTSTLSPDDYAPIRLMVAGHNKTFRKNYSLGTGISVRCIKDNY